MKKQRVLFVCIHNSARSQMAEAFLNVAGGDRFEAESAGLESGKINPLVVEVMREIGIDLSQKWARDVFEVYRQGKQYDYVVTVCDEASGERCPVFPGAAARLHWNFEDPSSFTGSQKEKLAKTRMVRDQIRQRIALFIKEIR